MSIAALQKQLANLQRTRRQILNKLMRPTELAVGTVSAVKRKCGKPTCHCATGEGHPQVLFLYTDVDGRRRCKLVRRVDETRLLNANKRYQEFKAVLRQLQAINQQEKKILLAARDHRALAYH
jgi:hypothetical protein